MRRTVTHSLESSETIIIIIGGRGPKTSHRLTVPLSTVTEEGVASREGRGCSLPLLTADGRLGPGASDPGIRVYGYMVIHHDDRGLPAACYLIPFHLAFGP